MLGTDWLNKVGIAFVVLGIAFFLSYELKNIGPAGKVLVGFVTAAAMLGGGIWFERRRNTGCPHAQAWVAGGHSCSSRLMRCITCPRHTCSTRNRTGLRLLAGDAAAAHKYETELQVSSDNWAPAY